MSNDRDRVISAEGETLKVRIFYSYTDQDQDDQKSLEKHLAILRQTGKIEEWHHRKIPAGEHRDYRMRKELVEADIILLLLTPDFIHSKYCYSTEMTFAIQAQKKGLAIVIPLLIRASSWRDTPLAGLQALPRNGEGIYDNALAATSGSQFEALLDREWREIAKEITVRVKHLLASPDDLLKKRQLRLALEREERSEAQPGRLPDATGITRTKKNPLSRVLVVLAVLLLMVFGGILALHVISGGGTFSETTGGDAHTWTDYSNGAGNPGPVIPSHKTVQITCKVTGLKVQDGDTWWYRIASSPWDNKHYLYLCTFWLSRLKRPTGHTRRRVGRQIGTAHEATPTRAVDGGVGSRAALPRW